MNEVVQFLKIFLMARVARAQRSERGASAVEWVIITVVLLTLAGVVGAIITNAVKGKAEQIKID